MPTASYELYFERKKEMLLENLIQQFCCENFQLNNFNKNTTKKKKQSMGIIRIKYIITRTKT